MRSRVSSNLSQFGAEAYKKHLEKKYSGCGFHRPSHRGERAVGSGVCDRAKVTERCKAK